MDQSTIIVTARPVVRRQLTDPSNNNTVTSFAYDALNRKTSQTGSLRSFERSARSLHRRQQPAGFN